VALSFAPDGSAIVAFRKSARLPAWAKVLRGEQAPLDSAPGWFQEARTESESMAVAFCTPSTWFCVTSPAEHHDWYPGQLAEPEVFVAE